MSPSRLRFAIGFGWVCALACATTVHAQAVDSYRQSIVIDFAALNPEETEAVVTALAVAQDRSSWVSIDVREKDTLYGILFEQYRFSDALFPRLTQRLVDLIADVNKVDPLKLPTDQPLRIPLLATRPMTDGASGKLTQTLDFETREAWTFAATDAFNPAAPRNTPASKAAGTWTTELSPAQYSAFVTALPERLRRVFRRGVYAGPLAQIGYFAVSDGAVVTAAAAGAAAVPPPTQLKGVLDQHVGRYYILDFFGSATSCSHGHLVMDAARQALQAIGKPGWIQRLEPVELDFFADRGAALRHLDTFLKSRTPREREVMTPIVEHLKSLRKPATTPAGRPFSVPLFYLQALYHNFLAAPDTDVISSSFWTVADGFQTLPNSYLPDSAVSMLSAVLDELITVESNINREPIASFYQRRHDLGLLLVGASTGPAAFSGMTSQSGDGVTLLADAFVDGTGPCQGQRRSGASFATPVIGVHALAAKAYWRSQKQPILAADLKRRLLLSGMREPAYVGKFASGGLPVLVDLLQSGAVGIDANGNRVGLADAVGHSEISIRSASGKPDTLVFRRDVNGFVGLEFRNGTVYVFTPAWNQWKPVELVGLQFRVSKTEILKSVQELSNRFRKVILL